ncbi:MAG: hypothetical protein LC650_00490 [Actinobacteria bacterium]|nr:hypothetical protein [Actinomycetota bacterium]
MMPDEELQRWVYEQVTDEMLTKPVSQLLFAERALLQSAFRGPYGQRLVDRLDDITANW